MLRGNASSLVSSLAVAVALAGAGNPAFAQVCTGFALEPYGTQVTVMGEFLDRGTTFGGSVARRSGGQLILGLGYAYTSVENSGELEMPNLQNYNAFGSYEIELNAGAAGPDFVACPNAQFSYTRRDEVDFIAIPVGVALTKAFEVADGILVAPFVNPALRWYRGSRRKSSRSGTDFGLTLGGNVSIASTFLVGAQYHQVGDDDAVFGLRFGFLF